MGGQRSWSWPFPVRAERERQQADRRQHYVRGLQFRCPRLHRERPHRQHCGDRQHRLQPRHLVGDRRRQGEHPVRWQPGGAESDGVEQPRLLSRRQRRPQRRHLGMQQRPHPEQLSGRRDAAQALLVLQHRRHRQHDLRTRRRVDAVGLSQQRLWHDTDRRLRRGASKCLRGRTRQHRDLQLGATGVGCGHGPDVGRRHALRSARRAELLRAAGRHRCPQRWGDHHPDDRVDRRTGGRHGAHPARAHGLGVRRLRPRATRDAVVAAADAGSAD